MRCLCCLFQASVANRPPVAVAMPSNQIVQQPQELKIDGSGLVLSGSVTQC